MQKYLLIAMSLSLGLSTAHAAAPTIQSFEKSAVFKKFTLVNSDSWALKVGGQNYLYDFEHPNGIDYLTIETGPTKNSLKRMSVHFPSDLSINKVEGREREFVVLALKFFAPKANQKAILKYIDSQINTSYDDGSSTYPRKVFGNIAVYSGRTGETIIGFELK